MMPVHQANQNQPQGQAPGQQGQQQPPAQLQPGQINWGSYIQAYVAFLSVVVYKYWASVQYFMFKYISHNYSDFMAVLSILLISSPVFFYRKRWNKYIQMAMATIFLGSIVLAFLAAPSQAHVERSLANQSIGNDFSDFAASLLNETHRIYGFFGRSGTGKTNIAEKVANIDATMLKRAINSRVFFLHNQASKVVADFFNPNITDSMAGWIQPGGGCAMPKCYLILEDLHLLLDYYYLKAKQPEQVELFFDKLQTLVRENPRAVVIMIIEVTAFSRSIDQSRIANVTSNEDLQKELKESNSVFCRLGDEYLSVYFKDVHRDYGQWKAAMQVHLNELVHNTILLSQAQAQPFDKGAKILFDESVFKRSRKLVYAFKDVKKFFLPRLYWKIIDANTPRDCTPANGRILTVYAKGDFNVKCEPCGWICQFQYSDEWTKLYEQVSRVPVEYFFRTMDMLKIL